MNLVATTPFTNARRINKSLTASAEKRALIWLAERAPAGSPPTNSRSSASPPRSPPASSTPSPASTAAHSSSSSSASH